MMSASRGEEIIASGSSADFSWGERRVAVVGLGLMGGSWAGAVKPFVAGVEGSDVREEARRGALDRGLVEAAWDGPGPWLRACELVVLAVPPPEVGPVARACLPYLGPGSLLTDVCSVKGSVVREVSAGWDGDTPVTYIPGHPLAGKERGGIEAADPGLFAGAPYVLGDPWPGGPEGERTFAALTALISAMGARVYRLSPRDHDLLVAACSHLPYLVAVALARLVGRVEAGGVVASRLVASGFRDTTRVALSPPDLWAEILSRNDQLRPVAELLLRQLRELLEAAKGDPASLERFLREGQRERQLLEGEPKGESGK